MILAVPLAERRLTESHHRTCLSTKCEQLNKSSTHKSSDSRTHKSTQLLSEDRRMSMSITWYTERKNSSDTDIKNEGAVDKNFEVKN